MAKMLKALGLALAVTTALTGVTLAQSSDLRVAITLEPTTLDPTAGAAAAIDEVVYQNIFEGLTRIDQNGAVQPGLAESWTISDDGLTYRFKLHDGVTFHDGSAFDAEDVKFSLDRISAEGSLNAQKALYASIASVTVVDPLTVDITLTGPDGLFLFNLGRGDAVMVAPESADNNATAPIGTGPFTFIEWDKGSRVVLEQYGPYWGDKPALTKATFVFITDTATQTNALLAGDIDGVNNFSASAIAIFENNPQFQVVVGTTEGETMIATNNRKPPFDDLRVRQAIAYAIDRQAIIDGTTEGFGVPIGSHFAPHNPYYVDLTNTYPHDVEKAKALLAEAGYPDGFSTTIKLPPPPYARVGGQIIASQLAAVGIKAQLINVEWAQWLEDVFTNKDYDLSVISHVEPFDIGSYANPDYYFGYDNPQFRTLIDTLNATTDDSKRKELAGEAQTMLAKDAVNTFLFELPQIGVWNSKLSGFWQNAPIEGVVLRDIRWSE